MLIRYVCDRMCVLVNEYLLFWTIYLLCLVIGVEKLSIIPNNDWLLDISDGNQETKQGITMSTLELLDLKGSKGQVDNYAYVQ